MDRPMTFQEIERDFRTSLQNNEIQLYYQPQYNHSTHRMIGAEALMDDFGSGYSSLNALKDLPVDAIKLDMNFLSSDINGRRI